MILDITGEMKVFFVYTSGLAASLGEHFLGFVSLENIMASHKYYPFASSLSCIM